MLLILIQEVRRDVAEPDLFIRPERIDLIIRNAADTLHRFHDMFELLGARTIGKFRIVGTVRERRIDRFIGRGVAGDKEQR
jgi:hypothetical protein